MSAQPIDFSSIGGKPVSAPSAGAIDFSSIGGKQVEAPKVPPAQRTWKDSVSDTVSEWWKQVNPVANAQGAAQAVNHPIDTIKNMGAAQGAVLDKAIDAFKKGDHIEGVRHFLNYLTPIIGPQTDAAGDLLDKGEYAKAAGMTAGIATNVATPVVANKVAGMISPSAAAPVAERMYQSALKPPPASYSTPEVANMVKTGLDSGIPVSESGVAKIGSLIDDLNSKVKAQIQGGAKAGQTVNKFSVASRLSNTAKKFETQVNPEADLNAVSESGNEFIRNQPSNIAADDAQALKQGTYRQLSAKAYGEQGSAVIEAQKALARGIKEELENQFPEIKNLNAQEGKFINLDEVLQRAVRREANKQIFPMAGPVTGAAVGVATGSGPLGIVATVIKSVLDNPEAKSRLAIAINKGARGSLSVPESYAKVAALGAALGSAAGSANRGDQASPSTP